MTKRYHIIDKRRDVTPINITKTKTKRVQSFDKSKTIRNDIMKDRKLKIIAKKKLLYKLG